MEDTVQLKVTRDYPISTGRLFDIMFKEQKVGEFYYSNKRWHAMLPRDVSQPYNGMTNYTQFAYSNYFAMIRVVACYMLGELDRIPYLLRGIWSNPCPTAEVIK